MFTLVRLLALPAAIYGFFVMSFPDTTNQVYHVASLAVVAGGAVGLFFFLKIIDVGSTMIKIGLELGFAVAVALYFGYTMPQVSGKAPLQQWAEGARPTQSTARRGLEKMHLDPDGTLNPVVKLFPKG